MMTLEEKLLNIWRDYPDIDQECFLLLLVKSLDEMFDAPQRPSINLLAEILAEKLKAKGDRLSRHFKPGTYQRKP